MRTLPCRLLVLCDRCHLPDDVRGVSRRHVLECEQCDRQRGVPPVCGRLDNVRGRVVVIVVVRRRRVSLPWWDLLRERRRRHLPCRQLLPFWCSGADRLLRRDLGRNDGPEFLCLQRLVPCGLLRKCHQPDVAGCRLLPVRRGLRGFVQRRDGVLPLRPWLIQLEPRASRLLALQRGDVFKRPRRGLGSNLSLLPAGPLQRGCGLHHYWL